jgi:PAS domain S-box-containing protein
MSGQAHDASVGGESPAVVRGAWRRLVVLVPAIATIFLSITLLAAIYFTLLDWQWVAFLSGTLFAALIALVSRASQAEWRIARRNVQLVRLKELLAREANARKLAESAHRASEAKMRLFSDAMPSMMVYIDAGQRFRFHNRAYREWIGLSDVQIDGHLMSEVLGNAAYAEVQDKVVKVLSGEQVTYEFTRKIPNGSIYRLNVFYLPHFDEKGRVCGFFGVLNDITERADLSAPIPASEISAKREINGLPLVVAGASGQTLYLNSMTEQLTGWNDPEARLRQAFDRDEFRLFVQQIKSVGNDGQMPPCYEILIRLQEEEDNLTPPGAFIPVAEQFNMTTQLDYWVVRNVINWHRRHRQGTQYWQSAMYCINLFASTISDENFADYVRARLAEGDVPPQVLCFEVNENEAIERLSIASRFVGKLRRFGCRVALGAFGEGKVSFDALKHLPVNFLKIDGSLVRDIENNPVNLAKVNAIGRVSKTLGVRTIAQFVESDDVLKQLANFGIDFAQGFGIAKPRPISEIQ